MSDVVDLDASDAREREERIARYQRDPLHALQDLLAVIHRDGGHYVAAHGIGRAVEDAVSAVYEARRVASEAQAIIAGRTTPPTDAEIAAHADASHIGAWLITATDGCRQLVHLWRPFDGDSRSEEWAMLRRRMGPFKFTIARWVPIDAEGRPCAWPVVTL